jgi:hypothetical protein
LIDGHGELVWFFPAPAASNVRAQLYRGKPVLTWFEGAIVSGHGEGHYELFDSSYQEVAQVHANGAYQGDLHEFLLTDAGTALFTCYGQATGALGAGEASDGAYYYGVVQEVDVATGRLLFEWRSDEHVSFDESYVPRPASPDVPWDYFHINSIDVDPIDGNLIISSRNAWAAYKLDRSSGEVLWRLGGKLSDFAMGTGACFAFQHDVRRHPDGTLTLFDDQAGPPDEASQSRGLVLRLDESSRTATVLDQYHHSPALLSRALGSMQDLGQGHRFVGWGISSYFTEYDSSGRAVFDRHVVVPGLQAALGRATGRGPSHRHLRRAGDGDGLRKLERSDRSRAVVGPRRRGRARAFGPRCRPPRRFRNRHHCARPTCLPGRRSARQHWRGARALQHPTVPVVVPYQVPVPDLGPPSGGGAVARPGHRFRLAVREGSWYLKRHLA